MDDAQRQSSAGMDLLGEIATNLSFHEINGVLDEEAEIILEMSDEELAPIVEAVNAVAKEKGKDAGYTVEDVRADRDGILYQMAARRAMEEFEINETETAKAAKAETAEAEAAKTETAEKAAKTADTTAEEEAGETEAKATEERREPPSAGFAYRNKSNDPERFLQVADAAGMEKNSEVRALAFDEYLAHHRDMDVRHFIDAYKLELAAGKYGIREEFPETARLNPETRRNARMAGEILRRDEDARARKKADGKADEKAKEKPVQKAAPKPAYNRNRVHLEDGLKAHDLKGDRRAVVDVAGIMANVMGNEIYIYDSRAHKGVEMPNGFIDAKGNLHIDIHAGTGGRELGLLALAHESVHFIKDYNPEGFREIGDKVVSLAEGAGVDVMALVRRKLDALEARGRTEGMSPSAAMDLAYEEVIADSMESVLQDGRAVEEMVELNPTLFESLIRHIKEIVDKIKKALAGLRPESEAGRILSEIAGAMDEVREMYAVALTHAGEARRDASSMNSEKMHDADSQTSGIVRESIRPEFESEINVWARKGMPEGETFILGETGPIIQGLGAMENDIFLHGDKIKTILNKHPEMTLDEIIKIPQILEDPVLVLKSRNVGRDNRENPRMTLFGSIKAKNGKPVMVVLDLRPIENRMIIEDMQKVSSAYSKTTDPVSFVKNSEVMYAEKERSRSLLRSIGFQAPMKLSDSGFIGSIAYKGRFVKLHGKEFSEVFSEDVRDDGIRYSDRAENPFEEAVRRSGIAEDSDGDTEHGGVDAFTEALGRSGIGTDRYLLATALESAVQSEREYSLLKKYKENLGRLESLSSELDSVNEELKRLTFAKGRDGAAIKSLQERKQGLVDKISKQDKRLLSLEAAKPLCDILERERRKARSEGRKEAEDKSRERRQSTDALNRRRVIVDIADRWLTLLEKPTKNRNIPKVMEPLVLDILSTINFDPADAEKLTNDIAAKIAEETAKESPDIDRIEKWKKAIDRIGEVRKNNADFAARVASLYRKAKVSKDADVQSAYDPAVEAKIDEISEMIGEKSLDELTFEELQEVRRTVAMVSHAITERKELFVSSSKQTVAEASEAIQNELSPIIDKRGKRKPIPGTDGRTPTFIKFWKGAYINELKPVYFFDEIESPTLRRMFGDLYTKGERTFARDLLEIRAFREKVDKKFKVKSWDRESRKEFETESGKVRLNLGQIMAIYADSKREQAVGHLLTGGFCLDPNEAEPVKIKGKVKTPIKTSIDDAKTYRLTEEQMWKIVGALTDKQRSYVDTMVRFLSSDLSRKGNEVSMKLYGVELFNEVFYFPIQTKSAYRAAATTQQKGDPMLKSMGMTKPTVPEAENPLVLSDFDAVWGKHCADMTSYHALVLPIEDLRRVFEYGSTDAEVGASSTKGAIINAYGEAAERYISTLLTDLNGGLRQDPTGSFTSKMISLMKKSRVMASLSVAVQQPLAAVRAMAMIDIKYFPSKESLKAGKNFTEQWELMKKYADTVVVKDIGFLDVGMGRRTADWINAPVYEGAREKGKAILTDSDYRDEVLGWLPSTADKWAWMTIWGAVENEVAATNGELTRGSEEFYRAVGERFDEVVRRTQVYDSLLSRSAFMRSKHAVMQMATAFMAEPTTTVNMMVAGIRQMAKGDKRAGARTLGVVYAAMLLTAVASSLVYAMRDDDEDETYGEKYVESLSEQVRPWTMFPNMIPFVRDAVSLMEGYDIQRTDMTIVADAVNAFNVVMSDKKDGYQKTEAAAGAIGTLFGIPVRNVMRDMRAVSNSLQNEAAGESSDLGYAFRKGFLGESASNGQRLYDLRLSGDKTQYARVAARYETEAKATAALRKALRDNDPRVAEAAEARLAGKTAEAIRIRGEIVAEGHFSDEEVLGAINAEVSAIKRLNAKEEEEA